MKRSKEYRGGARPGAGRKPATTRMKPRTIRMTTSMWVKLRHLAAAQGVNRAEWLRRKIEAAQMHLPENEDTDK